MDSESNDKKSYKGVSKTELNSWRRGFTPQAEIWNGRMAIVGLILFLVIVAGSNFLFSS
tara:strand:+ start:3298 stop:3474 length:177 start_codon:yes stop_codon:yes gene_type:complete